MFVRASLVFRIRSPLEIPIHAKQIGILLTHRFLIRPSFQNSIYTYYRLYLQISSPSHQHNLLQQMLEPLFSIIAPLPVSLNTLSPPPSMRCSVFGAISSHPASVPVLVIHILFVVSTTFFRAPRFVLQSLSQSVSHGRSRLVNLCSTTTMP